MEEFDDFDEDLDEGFELEEFDETEFDENELETRTVILFKKDMIALLGMRTATQGGTICRVDPRESSPAVQIYDDPTAAADWFKKSLRTSKKNGWQIAYDGLPLFG
jgi:hypothetical protein